MHRARIDQGSAALSDTTQTTTDDPTVSGSIPFGAGLPSVVRIPVPGSNDLAIELRPRGYVPKSGSTSSIFIQDATGRRNLRLDYGYNKTTKTIEYHWNQKGVFDDFGISNHQTAGRMAGAAHWSAKAYRWLGRRLVVYGLILDTYSVVVASKPIQRATEVAAAWAGAWAGCRVVGAGGAWGGGALGTAVPVLGNAAGAAIGGIGGCIIGGIAGYRLGEAAGARVYEWAEDTAFFPLPWEPSP